jgi:hypothetical protein
MLSRTHSPTPALRGPGLPGMYIIGDWYSLPYPTMALGASGQSGNTQQVN